mmetsp:Transcript_12747/g.28089  ORF Transcript_12747/g.28089 Transcript_12747/m.28089 type:complete len:225 (-) Transcript_12747:56-730(-)
MASRTSFLLSVKSSDLRSLGTELTELATGAAFASAVVAPAADPFGPLGPLGPAATGPGLPLHLALLLALVFTGFTDSPASFVSRPDTSCISDFVSFCFSSCISDFVSFCSAMASLIEDSTASWAFLVVSEVEAFASSRISGATGVTGAVSRNSSSSSQSSSSVSSSSSKFSTCSVGSDRNSVGSAGDQQGRWEVGGWTTPVASKGKSGSSSHASSFVAPPLGAV